VLAKALIEDKGWWVDSETSLQRFAKFPFVDQKVPEKFRRTLIENYGSRAEVEKKLGQEVEYPWEKQNAKSHGSSD